MKETKICPLFLNGWLSNHLNTDSGEDIAEHCKCREDCAWGGNGLSPKCQFINLLGCMSREH
jgi:hypothetical protein